MNDDSRQHDIVVFGATSFVGQILCRFLVERYGTSGSFKWAIAGRNAEKLESVATETGADVPRIVADAADESALRELAASTRLVISTVGPYAKFGSRLVSAVAATGTDYVDLTGEPHWMAEMIDAHHQQAVESGARIVHSCGFDSIPSDLGVWYTQQQAQAQFGQPCSRIRMQVRAMKGGASGGTVASLLNVVDEARSDPALRKLLQNPYALAPKDHRSGVRQPSITKPEQDDDGENWLAPFVMASTNTRIVFRSHALLGHPWGEDFTYDEAMSVGAGPLGLAKAAGLTGGLGGFMGLVAIGPTRDLLAKYVLPKPGEGPSPEDQENGFWAFQFRGETAAGDVVRVSVKGDKDPGYGSTAKMLAESALCLLDRPQAEVAGGFWTPATAMGDSLVQRLESNAGVTFEAV